MEILRKRALKSGMTSKPWATERDFPASSSSAYRGPDGLTIVLQAPIAKVQAVLAKPLKANRPLLSAVRFNDGRIEEIFEAPKVIDAKAEVVETEETKALVIPAKAKAAITVATPQIGCPMPDFGAAETRATEVLKVFLDDEQMDDFLKLGRFVTTGADTGHKYMVLSRERPSSLALYGGRQLYDLDEKMPLCVHDWTVPAAEEMLALHLAISLPGNEHRIRFLPETFAH